MIITPQLKQDIYERAEALMREWYEEMHGTDFAEQGSCLYWNQCAMKAIYETGMRARLCAGTMLWPSIRSEEDDGIRPTHFGYEWSPWEPFSRTAMDRGQLPEVHIWCAILQRDGTFNNVVDFSTQYFKKLAVERHGLTWTAPDPPQYVFGAPPARVLYQAIPAAERHVWNFIRQKFIEETQTQKDLCQK